MKKDKLWKVIFVSLIILIGLSWILPTSSFNDGVFSHTGYEPLGLLDIIFAPFQFFNWDFVGTQLFTDGTTVTAFTYTSILLVILTTGMFYQVLRKTGAYGKLVNQLAQNLKTKRVGFWIGTAIFFFLFASLVGVKILAFILIPFFVDILLELKHSRMSTFAATFFPCLLGTAVSLTGSNVTGINNIMYSLDIQSDLILKGIFFLLFLIIFLLYLVYKKEPVLEKKEEEKIPVSNRSYAPMILVFVFFFLILLVGSFNWYYIFGTTSVTDAYENLMSTSIGEYPIAMNLFGMMEPFGYWTGFTISAILLLASGIIAFIYSLSRADFIECLKDGMKRMIKPALAVLLASLTMVIVSKSGSSFLLTIIGFVYDHVTQLAVPITTLATTIYGYFISDYFGVSSILSSLINNFDVTFTSLAVLTMQYTHGLISLVAPTSLFLVAGLSYLEIPYQKWLSYVWKLVLLLAVITIVSLTIINVVSA